MLPRAGTDADGDTFIGTFVDEPGKPGAWTFLGGPESGRA
jgi:hypothetical protein